MPTTSRPADGEVTDDNDQNDDNLQKGEPIEHQADFALGRVHLQQRFVHQPAKEKCIERAFQIEP